MRKLPPVLYVAHSGPFLSAIFPTSDHGSLNVAAGRVDTPSFISKSRDGGHGHSQRPL